MGKPALTPGTVLQIKSKDYTIKGQLSQSTTSEVYSVESPDGSPLALKIYHRGDTAAREAIFATLRKLGNEAATVTISDYGTITLGSTSAGYSLMPLYAGGNATAPGLRANPAAVLQLVTFIARSLSLIHSKGILHGDVCPQSILFPTSQRDLCVLSDFDSAMMVMPGSGNKTLFASDYLALGLSAIAIWQGKPGDRIDASSVPAVPADIPDPLNRILRGLLVSDPAHRWGFDEIGRQLSGEKVPVFGEVKPQPKPEPQPQPQPKKQAPATPAPIKLHGAKTVEEKYMTAVVCKNPMEVIKFCADYPIIHVESKRYLCSEEFIKMVEFYSPADAAKLKAIQGKGHNTEAHFRFVVQTLNPLADINLCADPKDPRYAMTGPALGRLINEVFNAYYARYNGDAKQMHADWYSPDNPWRNEFQSSFAQLIAQSFAPGAYRTSYLHLYLARDSRFKDFDRWASYCCDFGSKANKEKYAPYDSPIAMLKTAAGFGHKVEYALEDGTRVKTLDEVNTLSDDSTKDIILESAVENGSFHAFVAVLCQENPDADLSETYTFEGLTIDYITTLGGCCPDYGPYRRYEQAFNAVSKSGHWHPVRILGWMQSLLVIVGIVALTAAVTLTVWTILMDPWIDPYFRKKAWLLLCPLVFVFLLNNYFSEDGIYDGLGSTIGGFFYINAIVWIASRLIMWHIVPYIFLAGSVAFLIHFLKKLLPKHECSDELRDLSRVDPEAQLLEPLHFAFKSKEATFKASNDGLRDDVVDTFRESVKSRRGLVALLLITAFILAQSSIGYYMVMKGYINKQKAETGQTEQVSQGTSSATNENTYTLS